MREQADAGFYGPSPPVQRVRAQAALARAHRSFGSSSGRGSAQPLLAWFGCSGLPSADLPLRSLRPLRFVSSASGEEGTKRRERRERGGRTPEEVGQESA